MGDAGGGGWPVPRRQHRRASAATGTGEKREMAEEREIIDAPDHVWQYGVSLSLLHIHIKEEKPDFYLPVNQFLLKSSALCQTKGPVDLSRLQPNNAAANSRKGKRSMVNLVLTDMHSSAVITAKQCRQLQGMENEAW
ncbi:hypothetical protein ACET3Z_008868 [Daucus carota]